MNEDEFWRRLRAAVAERQKRLAVADKRVAPPVDMDTWETLLELAESALASDSEER